MYPVSIVYTDEIVPDTIGFENDVSCVGPTVGTNSRNAHRSNHKKKSTTSGSKSYLQSDCRAFFNRAWCAFLDKCGATSRGGNRD